MNRDEYNRSYRDLLKEAEKFPGPPPPSARHDEVCRAVGANFVPCRGQTPDETFEIAKKDAIEAEKYKKTRQSVINAIGKLTLRQYQQWVGSIIPRVMGKAKP